MFKKLKLRTKIVLIFSAVILILFGIVNFSLKVVVDAAKEKTVQSYKDQLLEEKKDELNQTVTVVHHILMANYSNYIGGIYGKKVSLEEVQKRTAQEIEVLRYDNNVGYFFINDTGKPYPKMIMHPTLPNLNGQILTNESFNTVGKEKKNLFIAFVEICEKDGSGYVSYLWPKPTTNGLTAQQPKMTYVALFKPWNWIVGSGVYIDDVDAMVAQHRKIIEDQNNSFFLILILVLFGIFVLLIPFVAIVLRIIFLPLKKTAAVLVDISRGRGDLTRRIPYSQQDEIGKLAEEFNHFLDKLNGELLKVDHAADDLQKTTERSRVLMQDSGKNITVINDSINQINKQTENSTSSIEELTATVEEMSRNIDSIMGNMLRQASAVEEGASSIEEMVRNIENTASMSKKTQDISNNLNKVSADGGTAVKASVQSIKEVSDYSQQILKLLGLITNIAKQTNLLAMNAAIEAAHAGDAGKGFAIVADEIRRLSEDTNKNARDIGEVVSSIVSKIDDSVKLSEKAGVGLDMITAYSQQNVQIISQLSIAMAEQNNGAKEILKSTQEMVRITEEVKLNMTEQKNAMDDFTSALRGLRDLSLDNKENLNRHVANFSDLTDVMEKIGDMIEANQKRSEELLGLVQLFILDRSQINGNETTSLKLVE